MSATGPRPVVPEDLPKLLHSLSYAVLKNKPQNMIEFAAEHFQQLYDEREHDKEVSPGKEEIVNDAVNTKEENSEDDKDQKKSELEENESSEDDDN